MRPSGAASRTRKASDKPSTMRASCKPASPIRRTAPAFIRSTCKPARRGSAWPSPEALWALAFPEPNVWRDRFAAVPLVEKGIDWTVRYYQANAVNNALAQVSAGGRRVLLTLATGTGKTTIAFQIAWKLFEAKWNLSGEPTRRPRILFLADRNNLADQAYNDFSSFASFAEDAFVRIKPGEIARKGRVPKNGSIFFTIFQTFMSGRDAEGHGNAVFRRISGRFFRLHHHR